MNNELFVYKYRCRDCKIKVEVYSQTTNLIEVYGRKEWDWMQAISDSAKFFYEDYHTALEYIKSKTARRWLHKVYREINNIKYCNKNSKKEVIKKKNCKKE